MMRPGRFAAIIARPAACATKNAPFALVSITKS